MPVLLVHHYVLIASALVAVLIPFTFIIVREATKVRRQGIIENLVLVFQRSRTNPALTMPSFEFVKYKYFIVDSSYDHRDPKHSDFTPMQWIVGGVPLVLYLSALNAFCGFVLLHQLFKMNFAIGVTFVADNTPTPLFAWIVVSAHVAGVLFTLRAFNQAINNFDLSPLSLVGATVNLAFGVATALLITYTVWQGVSDLNLHGLQAAETFPAMVATAFAAGYFPDVAVRNILRLSQLRSYKRDDESIYNSFKAVPIEVIDGIDSEIRNRLSDYHIASVQNLAAANPLMLFVETPFGVYQIMDWVAQAQLCASVGPTTLLALWRLGIRTIFDLERVALDDRCYDDDLIREIGAILWQGHDHGRAMARGEAVSHPPAYPTLSAIRADIRFRLESPHVHRLRQIFNQVSESIGDEARCLPPIGGPARGRFRHRPPFARRSSRRAAQPFAAAAWGLFALWCIFA